MTYYIEKKNPKKLKTIDKFLWVRNFFNHKQKKSEREKGMNYHS